MKRYRNGKKDQPNSSCRQVRPESHMMYEGLQMFHRRGRLYGKDAWLTGGLPPIRNLESVSLRLYNLEVRYEAFRAMRMMNH